MSTRRMIIGLVVSLSIAVFVGQTLSQTPRSNQRVRRPDPERLRNMTPEERDREYRKWAAQSRHRMDKRLMEARQRAKDRRRETSKLRNEYIRQILRATEEQWKVIEPKINEIYFLKSQTGVRMGFGTGGAGYGGGAKDSGGNTGPGNNSNSVSSGLIFTRAWGLADRAATEGERICEELLELLEDKNSQPEKIRQQMDALRQAREKAKEQLGIVQQELRKVVTFHQEAKLVLIGLLD